MKKALTLNPVSVQVINRDLGAFGTSTWFVHTLIGGDGDSSYLHWNKSEKLLPGYGERVLMKIGKTGAGKPVLRRVNIEKQ